MKISASLFQKRLNEFDLKQLFNEMGWANPTLRPQSISVDGQGYTLTQVAQNHGVAVFRCTPDAAGHIPPRSVQLKIDRETTKIAHEHLLVFADQGETMLTWLWVLRVPGQPTATRTHTWRKGQSGESLRQKLEQIVWSLEEEEAVTLTDVITGLRRAFDRDQVSKRFYDKFKAQHGAFAKFIKGLKGEAEQAWYASLMLNRLMFVYFIQKKGFLHGDENYLSNRMAQVQAQAGKDQFHSFYRQFLRRLFHEGLGQPKAERDASLAQLIGDVPYLNGGLFAVHELEEANDNIDVSDEAFEQLFAFFDAWDWHLDDRPLSSGKEINPDVLGYIFEKYINQKQMGAYYTKEDITEYISKNTVIPYLLEQTRARCKVAFDGEASIWNLLSLTPERYLNPAMTRGVIDASGVVVPETSLPDFVCAGMQDAEARMFDRRYNLGDAVFATATGERGSLPNETWREYVERRTRCLAVREKLLKGEVNDVDTLITLNLDIRQFVQDVIDTCSSPDLLRAVWQAIVGRSPDTAGGKFHHGITVLDPTCGSGAFLFAALNVLEPLYESCLDRMDGFVQDAKKLNKACEADFENVLAEVDKHPSRRYYIYKSIILHNLFGVDIMAEAVEICKLRLFLKLVSQVDGERGRDLEPLPDIDFNIRTGNTLIGYATEAQFDGSKTLASDQTHRAEIKGSIAELAKLFDQFRNQQTLHGGKVTSEEKRRLREKLRNLSLELDKDLARDYGIDPTKKTHFSAWRESHQPFHWFAEFYSVMHDGGFDVVIGNPPWKEYSSVKKVYTVKGYATEACGNLYGLCSERSLLLCHESTRFSFIVQMPLVCSSRMNILRSTLRDASSVLWAATFDDRPGKLFDGLQHCRSTIFFAKRGQRHRLTYTTRYHRWPTSSRNTLFSTMYFVEETDSEQPGRIIAKHPSTLSSSVFNKVRKASTLNIGAFKQRGESTHFAFYQEATQYWTKVTSILPFYAKNGVQSANSHARYIYFGKSAHAQAATALLNSSLFYSYFVAYSDCFHLSDTLATNFPVPAGLLEDADLAKQNMQLMRELASHAERKKITSRAGGGIDHIEYDEFYGSRAKASIDKIDLRLASLYGLTAEETDFVINYDIKYRMAGADAPDDE
ncbi:Eco57I restriction-modification methylase domain-containing protein [Paraburkholderia metrosideri]|uniref:site-specific DNA-methyltransferase (adenine-specific) n=1 Tax=Paraburkholderia metrosideri TaxID=580937 RepID=A0ABM8P5V3_9BURK|nr:type IIL restriction-modification enzyme MmeI [Paraburkholderia metrosideri]CAD6557074.1 hypothetical protein LMG28140_06059 [Paraburkholderia metrosideri]